MRLLILTFILTLVAFPRHSAAQDDFRFQPPAAPPLDVDFGDDDEDELGDFSRPPGVPAPVMPGANNEVRPNPVPPSGELGAGPPLPGGGGFASGGGGFGTPGGNFGGTTTSAGKFRFQVVPGEFWAKGKKRQRGNETHVTDSGDSRADEQRKR